jgi:threonine dehydratase
MIRDFAEVKDALQVLRPYFPPSPLVRAPSLSRAAGTEVFLKLESELPTGSFKVRGALFALLARLRNSPTTEVVASSTGNHGAAVAYAASLVGIRATIFLPRNPNPRKRQKIADAGANIVETGNDITDAFHAAVEYAERNNAYLLNDATDQVLPAGPATIACEILDQTPDATAMVVPIGDSALIRGIAFAAKHLRPDIRIVGVQARNAPSYYLSWTNGRATETADCNTIADGLATRSPVQENVDSIRDLVDQVCLVTEEEMLIAIKQLALHEHVIAEPAGAAAAAAYMAGLTGLQNGRVILIVSGGNVAEDVLQRALALPSLGETTV